MKKDIYIFKSGELKRKDNTLFFESQEGKKFIPIEETDNIYVFGEVDINKRFLDYAGEKEICLHFFNYYGDYSGSYYPRQHLNSGFVTLQQAEYYLDYEKRVVIAKNIILAALRNIQIVLRYYNKNKEDFNSTIEIIKENMLTIKESKTIEEIMAQEANSRIAYYKAFNNIIKNPDFYFEKRTKRPPKDKINALISFGNSMMYVTVLSEIYKTNLDPRIGYLHSTNERRFTLNLDIAEVFKPIIVDREIFSLLNKNILTTGDFKEDLNGTILKEDSMKKFVQAYNEKLMTTINHYKLNREVSYKRLIRMELYKLQKHITGEATYEGFTAEW